MRRTVDTRDRQCYDVTMRHQLPNRQPTNSRPPAFVFEQERHGKGSGKGGQFAPSGKSESGGGESGGGKPESLGERQEKRLSEKEDLPLSEANAKRERAGEFGAGHAAQKGYDLSDAAKKAIAERSNGVTTDAIAEIDGIEEDLVANVTYEADELMEAIESGEVFGEDDLIEAIQGSLDTLVDNDPIKGSMLLSGMTNPDSKVGAALEPMRNSIAMSMEIDGDELDDVISQVTSGLR